MELNRMCPKSRFDCIGHFFFEKPYGTESIDSMVRASNSEWLINPRINPQAKNIVASFSYTIGVNATVYDVIRE